MVVPANNEAPDEAAHVDMITFLKRNHRIPVFNRETEIIPTQYSQSLLSGAYYSMAYISPVAYLPYLPLYPNTTSDLSKLAVLADRVVSAFFVGLFTVFLFLGLFNLDPKKEKQALAATLFIALFPQVIFAAGYINVESPALFLMALSFYFYTRLSISNTIKSGMTVLEIGKYLTFGSIFFGLSIGLLGLMKANYLIFVGFLILLIIFDVVKAKDRLSEINKYLGPAVLFIAVNVWWWIRNVNLYHDPLILGYIKREIIAKAPDWLLTPRMQGYNLFTIFGNHYFAKFTFLGFFANLGGANIFLPTIFYVLFFVIIISLILIAFLSTLKRGLKGKRAQALACEKHAEAWTTRKRSPGFSLLTDPNSKYLVSFSIILIASLLYFASKNLDDFSPQGRHLFPLLLPLAIIIFIGLGNLPTKISKFSFTLPAFSLIASLYGLFLTLDKYYVKGTIYINQSNMGKYLPDFSWRHPSLAGFRSLYVMLDLPSGAGWAILSLSLVLILSLVLVYSSTFNNQVSKGLIS